jgi:hypothetical protein
MYPVSPRKIVQELSQKYDIVFVHQNNDYKNWIGVINDSDSSSVYWDIRYQGEPLKTIATIQGTINSVQQIGNTISLITGDNIYYLFYQNKGYTFLGEIPQIPVIGLKTSDEMSTITPGFYFTDLYGRSGDFVSGVTPDNFIDATKGLVNKAMDAIMNGYTDNDGVFHEGLGLQLFDACFIRYAFRLYDGTLTKHSPPILIMPVRSIAGKEEEGSDDSIKSVFYGFFQLPIPFDDRKGLIYNSRVNVYGYRIYIHYNFTDLWSDGRWVDYTNWKDIIQSVDIFMSAPLGISNIENIRKDMSTAYSSINAPSWKKYNLIKGISPEALKNVSNTSTFYLIKSIPLGSSKSILDPEPFPSSDDSDISKMENLIYQEVMTDDNFSNHKHGAEVSYTYNNRLHLANIKTTFFEGFNPDYFLWYNTADTADGNYNGFKYADAQGPKYANLLIEVEINTGLTNQKEYRYLSDPPYFPVYKMFMSAFISYPDPRAKRITIYRQSGGQWYRVFTAPLETHNLLSLSYCITDSLKPLVETSADPVTAPVPTSHLPSITEPNKIKVSELSNPLRFPNINTYQVGNGTILAMATNAMNVSDRNYGQYPLYVFTTQGVWTLNVGGGEVVYSTQTAPASAESPTTGIVGETPLGVVFTTQRGLMIINGQQVQFISPQIEQVPMVLNMETNSHCDGVVFPAEHRKFSELLKGLSGLIYNHYENELIINVKDAGYNYILNFDNQQFYQSTEKLDISVLNAFPELFVIDGFTLKDYASAENPLAHVSFILRPLLYGTPDIKRLERMILNALLYNVTNPAGNKFSLAMVHHSNDGVNFRATIGFPLKEGNHRDFDMGLSSGSKHNRFLFTFAGVVDEKSRFNLINTEVDKEYNNTKMR